MRVLGAIVIGTAALVVATACTDDAMDTTADWSVPTPGTLVDACVDGNRDDGGEYLVGSSLGTEGVATVAVDAGAEVEVGYGDWRPGDQRWYVSDTRSLSRAIDLPRPLGWRSGLERLARWLRTDGRDAEVLASPVAEVV